MSTQPVTSLPGLNCGLCGYQTCDLLAARLLEDPSLLKRCIHLDRERAAGRTGLPSMMPPTNSFVQPMKSAWVDSLGREFDFVLRHFPGDPGPREIIIPHNPMITRELEVSVGDVLLAAHGVMRPRHALPAAAFSGVAHRWRLPGASPARATASRGFKDLGYYIAEAYEGLIKEARCEIKIGARYFFQPEMCMYEWRHSGLVNYVNRTGDELRVRVETESVDT
ncbi:MAG: (Fe-S)-binding protein [Acidobacteriota bacterium]